MYSFPNFEPIYCSMFIANCCFLTCIQISQEADQVVWYYHSLNYLMNLDLFLDSVIFYLFMFQFSSVTQLCPTLCDPMNCSMPGLPVHHQLPKFTQAHVHQDGDAISSSVIPFSYCPQSLPASESFPMTTFCMRCRKYWSFSFSIIPSKEIPGLISFRMDWLDLLAVQGTLKSLLQYHSSKA